MRRVAWQQQALSELGEIAATTFGTGLVILARSNHAVNFDLTPEQQTLQKAAIEFARKELNNKYD